MATKQAHIMIDRFPDVIDRYPSPPTAYWTKIETELNAELGLAAALEIRTMCLQALQTVLRLPVSPGIGHAALDAWLLQNTRSYAQKKQAQRVFSQQFVHVRPDDPESMVLTALAETLPGRRKDVIRDYMVSRWRQLMGRDKERLAPDHARFFLPALVALAEADFRFQLEVQRGLRRYLETRVLLYPDGENTIRVSSVTHLFLLVAFCKAQDLPDHISQSLSQIAEREAKQSGWAGFWDMWLLSQAATAGLSDAGWAWVPFPDPMELGAGNDSHNAENLWMMAPDWQQGIPAFASSLLTDAF